MKFGINSAIYQSFSRNPIILSLFFLYFSINIKKSKYMEAMLKDTVTNYINSVADKFLLLLYFLVCVYACIYIHTLIYIISNKLENIQ